MVSRAKKLGLALVLALAASAAFVDTADADRRRHRRGDGRDEELCRPLFERFHYNNAKIRELEHSRRSRKALRWYREDQARTRETLMDCRRGRLSRHDLWYD